MRDASRPRWVLVVAGLAVFALLSGLGIFIGLRWGILQPAATHAPTSPGPRPAVAVIGFSDTSGSPESAWISPALSEMLTSELSVAPRIRAIPGGEVARMKSDLELPNSDALTAETLARIRTNIGTDLIVVGSYLTLGDATGGRVRVSARVQDASTGETLITATEEGVEKDIVDLASRIGTRLRGRLASGKLTSAEERQLKASLPSSRESARLYAEGLVKLRQFDFLSARDLLDRAVAADPQFALAHAALSDACGSLGFAGEAEQEARKAYDLSSGLPHEIRLCVEAAYLDRTGEVEREAELLRELGTAYPDNLDYGLSLATAEAKAGHLDEAYATLDRLRRTPLPSLGDPRIDLAEAWFADDEPKRKLAAATRAAQAAGRKGARSLVDDALIAQGNALEWMGEIEKAESAYEEARRIRAALGDRWGVGKASSILGALHCRNGDLEKARDSLQQSIEILREFRGSRPYEAEALDRMGNVLMELGDHAAARRTLIESYRIIRDAGDGILSGCPFLPDNALCDLAILSAREGNLLHAKQLFEQILQRARAGDQGSLIAEASLGLGRVLRDRGDLDGAERALNEASAIWTDRGFKALASEAELARALVALEQGRPADAESLCLSVAGRAQSAGMRGLEASGRALLAWALMARGDSGAAAAALGRAEELSRPPISAYQHVFVIVTLGRVRASYGDPRGTDPVPSLQAAVRDAQKHGFTGLLLEARLALAAVDLKQGRNAAALGHLSAVESDARAKGFLLIAELARGLARGFARRSSS